MGVLVFSVVFYFAIDLFKTCIIFFFLDFKKNSLKIIDNFHIFYKN